MMEMMPWIAAALLLLAQDPPKDPSTTVAVRKSLEGLGKSLTTIAVNPIPLWWVVDQSASMSDDREAIAAEIDAIFTQLPADKKIRMGIIGYEKSATVLAKATTETDKTQKALRRIGVAKSGTENVAEAVRLALKALAGNKEGAIVIVTDEEGDDLTDLAKLIDDVKAAHVRVCVLGREAVFGWEHAYEREPPPAKPKPFASPILVAVEAGPESAARETLQMSPLCCWQDAGWGCRKSLIRPEFEPVKALLTETNPIGCDLAFDDAVGSGFGPWALTQLAKKTGGEYFILGEPSCPTEKLEGYEPDWALDPASESAKVTNTRSVVTAVLAEVDRARTLGLSIRFLSKDEGHDAVKLVPRAERSVNDWLDRVRKAKTNVVATGGVKPYRRWEAHRDLLEAQILALLHYTEQYRLALDEGPYPKAVPHGLYIVKGKMRGNGARRDMALKALKAVEDAHPDTPWARTAAKLAKNLEGFDLYASPIDMAGSSTTKPPDR